MGGINMTGVSYRTIWMYLLMGRLKRWKFQR